MNRRGLLQGYETVKGWRARLPSIPWHRIMPAVQDYRQRIGRFGDSATLSVQALPGKNNAGDGQGSTRSSCGGDCHLLVSAPIQGSQHLHPGPGGLSGKFEFGGGRDVQSHGIVPFRLKAGLNGKSTYLMNRLSMEVPSVPFMPTAVPLQSRPAAQTDRPFFSVASLAIHHLLRAATAVGFLRMISGERCLERGPHIPQTIRDRYVIYQVISCHA